MTSHVGLVESWWAVGDVHASHLVTSHGGIVEGGRAVGDLHFGAFEEEKVEEIDFASKKRFVHHVCTEIIHSIDVWEQ